VEKEKKRKGKGGRPALYARQPESAAADTSDQSAIVLTASGQC